jgi:2-polyprenyl-3-methyl-5-hydroxy-6-metoxy-1,4-benzoquinol methylase
VTEAVGTRLDRLARQWAEALAGWAIPADILEAAPEPPWGFSPAPLADASTALLEEPDATPSWCRARQGLTEGGSVLDVGSGAGAASLALAPPASRLSAIDEDEAMLAAFGRLATERGVRHSVALGRWPDVAPRVPPADVVVCHHVVYNVAGIVPFLHELDAHARRRVVIELTESHPLSTLNAVWRELHGIERPSRPRADDLVSIVDAMAVPLNVERFTRPLSPSPVLRRERVALARRRLCVGPEHDEEISRLLPTDERSLVTVWWDTS